MALPAEQRRYTFADALAWDDGERAEIIDGKIFMMTPPPSRVHQEISFEISRQIGNYLEGKRCKVYPAPFGVRLFEQDGDSPEDVDTMVEPYNQRPQTPLFASVYSGARYSQTSSNTQRELMQPDEILRLDRRQCIALFQGRKPALLYKLAPEEFPDYGTLKSCRVADYIPEWRFKEEQAQAAKETPPPKPKTGTKPAPGGGLPDFTDEPNPTIDLEHQMDATDSSLGMVELGADGVLGGNDEDEENPPGR